MGNSLVQAFLVGRAVAEVINERLEHAVTDTLSEIGKLDAELKEQFNRFAEDVMERANRSANSDITTAGLTTQSDLETPDVQTTIDELRAEIALLRTELQNYRS